MLQSWKILQSDQGQDTSTIFQRQTEVKIGSVQTLIAMEPRTNESTSLKLFHVHCSIFYLYCLSLTEDAFSNSSLPENFHSRISDFIGRKNKWNWSHFSFQFKCRKKISDHFCSESKVRWDKLLVIIADVREKKIRDVRKFRCLQKIRLFFPSKLARAHR